MNRRAAVDVNELKPLLTCILCKGLLIHPTIIKECTHNFCRDCLVRYFNSKASDNEWNCPKCSIHVVSGRISQEVKANVDLQEVIWRLFPALYTEEMKNRREYYTKNSAALAQTLAEFPKTGPYSIDDEHGRGERDLECDSMKNNVSVMLSYLSLPVPDTNNNSNNDSSNSVLERARTRAEQAFKKPKLITSKAACEVVHIRSMLANVLECEQPQLIRILYNEQHQLYLSEALGDIGEVTCCTQPNKLHLQFCVVPVDAAFSTIAPAATANTKL